MDKLKITKWVDESSDVGVSSITFQRDGHKAFEICFSGNLDLYFILRNYDSDPTFLIGKDNYQVYEIFDALYREIMNGITSSPIDYDWENFCCDLTGEDYAQKIIEIEKSNEEKRKRNIELAINLGLIDNDEIIWKCDDFEHDIAPFFKITKLTNSYLITFCVPIPSKVLDYYEKQMLLDFNKHISIRIRNNGSSYITFNIPFMKAFNSLLEIPDDYHQVHIEEYMIEQEVKSGKCLEKILKA